MVDGAVALVENIGLRLFVLVPRGAAVHHCVEVAELIPFRFRTSVGPLGYACRRMQYAVCINYILHVLHVCIHSSFIHVCSYVS